MYVSNFLPSHQGFKSQSHHRVIQHVGLVASSFTSKRLQLILNPNDKGLCRGYLQHNQILIERVNELEVASGPINPALIILKVAVFQAAS